MGKLCSDCDLGAERQLLADTEEYSHTARRTISKVVDDKIAMTFGSVLASKKHYDSKGSDDGGAQAASPTKRQRTNTSNVVEKVEKAEDTVGSSTQLMEGLRIEEADDTLREALQPMDESMAPAEEIDEDIGFDVAPLRLGQLAFLEEPLSGVRRDALVISIRFARMPKH